LTVALAQGDEFLELPLPLHLGVTFDLRPVNLQIQRYTLLLELGDSLRVIKLLFFLSAGDLFDILQELGFTFDHRV
jgi:hypothetical protein